MAENVVVTINVRDLGSAKVQKFAKNTKTALNSVGGTVKTTNNVFSNFTKTLAGNTGAAFAVLPAYAAVGAIIGGMGAIVGTAIKDFIDFDKALREASSIAPELARNFETARQSIIALDPALGKTGDIALGLFETLSAGISIGRSIAESIQFTADAAKLARAALTDQATAVKALSTTMSAFGADIKQATQFSDIFQKTVVIGQFRFEELANSLGRVSPVAATLGISFSEMNAAVATLSQGGLSAAESVTALRAALNNIIKNADKFRAAGINVNAVLSEKDGLVKLMGQLRAVTGGNTEALTKFVPNIRGLVAALALTGPQYEALIKNNEITKNALGETDKAFQENQKSVSAALERLGASFDRAVQSRFGTQLAENVSDSMDAMGDTMVSVSKKSGFLETALASAGSTLVVMEAGVFKLGEAYFALTGEAVGAAEGILRIVPGADKAANAAAALEAQAKQTGIELGLMAKEAFNFGKDLLFGTVRVQEALNAQLDAQNDVIFAQQQAARAAKTNIDILGAIEKGANLAATSMGGFGDSAEGAAANLKGMGIAGLNTATKTEQLRDQLIGIITSTDTYQTRLEALSGGMVKNLNQTDELADKTRDLGVQYVTTVSEMNKARTQLQELGATADELSGRVKITGESIFVMSESTGKSVDEIIKLVIAMESNEKKAQSLGQQLRKTGLDVESLTSRAVQLREQINKSLDPTVKFAAALQALGGTTLGALDDELQKTLVAVNFLAEEGSTQTEFLIDTLEKMADKYKKIGQDVPDQLEVIIDKTKEIELNNRTALESFERLRGVKLTDLVDDIKELTFELNKFGGTGSIVGNALRGDIEKLRATAKQAFGNDIPQSILNTIKAQETLARSTTSVLDAFEAINGITLEKLESEVRAKLANIEKLWVAGLIGAEQMESEIEGVKNQFKLLGPAAQAGIKPIIDGLERSIPLAQTLADSLSLLGAKTIVELKQNAELAGNAFIQAFRSGTISGKELVRTFESEVAPAFEAAGLRIPNSLLLAFEKARGRSEIEAARLGNQIGRVLGDNIAKTTENVVTNRVGQVISTIADRLGREIETITEKFDRIAPGTTKPVPGITFGSGVEELLRNKEQIRQAQLGTRGATGARASSIEQLNKAMDIIDGRLADLGFKAAFADAAFTKFKAVPINKLSDAVRDSTSSMDSNFARTTNNINTATDALNNFSRASAGVGTSGEFSFTSNISEVPTGSTGGSLVTGTSGTTGGSAAFTGGTSLFGRFQSGISFAQQGQLARLDQGEMVVPRDIAKRLRSLSLQQQMATSPIATIGQAIGQGASFRPGPRNFVPGLGFVGSIIIGRSRPSSSLESAGFQFVPGFGTVPTPALAAATGNTDKLGGENSQREIQKNVVTLVRGAITRRDLTRDISGATALTNKGQPSTGGS